MGEHVRETDGNDDIEQEQVAIQEEIQESDLQQVRDARWEEVTAVPEQGDEDEEYPADDDSYWDPMSRLQW